MAHDHVQPDSGILRRKHQDGQPCVVEADPAPEQPGPLIRQVASYHAPNEGYPADAGYFTSLDAVWRLHAPSGSNGVFVYAGSSMFPNQTFNATN